MDAYSCDIYGVISKLPELTNSFGVNAYGCIPFTINSPSHKNRNTSGDNVGIEHNRIPCMNNVNFHNIFEENESRNK